MASLEIGAADQAAWGKFSIEDLLNLEQQTRAQSDAKGEEQRLVVGHRYRTLIESADEIQIMDKLAQGMSANVNSLITGLDTLLTRVKTSHLTLPETKMKKSGPNTYGQDGFEQVWSCVSQRKFVAAAHVYKSALTPLLSAGGGEGKEKRVIQQQRAALTPVLQHIVSYAASHLKLPLSVSQACDALSALRLCSIYDESQNTEHASFEKLMDVFLKQRSSCFRRSVKVANRALTAYPRQESPQLVSRVCCDLIDLLVNTTVTVHNLWQQGALYSFYAGLHESDQAEERKISANTVQNAFKAWYNHMISALSAAIAPIFGRLTSGKSIALVRDAILLRIRECRGVDPDGSLYPEEQKQQSVLAFSRRREAWGKACDDLLGARHALYSDVFASVLEPHMLSVISSLFTDDPVFTKISEKLELLTSVKADVVEPVTAIQTKLVTHMRFASGGAQGLTYSAYVDKDEEHVTMPRQSSVSVGSGGEGLRTAAVDDHMPVPYAQGRLEGRWASEVTEIVQMFEDTFTNTAQSVSYLLNLPDVTLEDEVDTLTTLVGTKLRPAVQEMCTASASKLIASITVQLNILEETMLDLDTNAPEGVAWKHIDAALFLGSLCLELSRAPNTALAELLALRTEVVVSSNASPIKSTRPKYAARSGRSFTQRSFLDAARLGYSVWSRYISEKALVTFSQSVESQCDLYTEQHANETVGDPEKSLPSQASAHVHAYLFELQTQLSRVTGYAVNKEVLGWLIGIASVDTLHMLSQQFTSHDNMSTPGLYQLLFDVMFLFTVLRTKPASGNLFQDRESKTNSAESLITSLEDRLDPINYSVCRTIMRDRVSSTASRFSLLYGSCLRANPFPPVAGLSDSTEHPLFPAHTLSRNSDSVTALPLVPVGQSRTATLPVSLYPLKAVPKAKPVSAPNKATNGGLFSLKKKKPATVANSTPAKSSGYGFGLIDKLIGN